MSAKKAARDKTTSFASPAEPQGAVPSITLRKHVIEAGLNPRISLNDLLTRVEEIGGSMAIVREAAYLAMQAEHKRHLAQKLGVRERTDRYFLSIAMTVASMNLDHTQDAPLSSGKYRKIKIDINGAEAAQRVTSIVASLLQEHVAHGVIKIEHVARQFGQEVADLTDEMARITRIPITLRDPDERGRLSYADAHFNRIQHELGQNMIHGTQNPSRVWLVKTAAALQELRHLDEIDDITVKRRTALHIQGMYLPLVREAGIREIQKEMQDRLLRQLDPQAYHMIHRQLDVGGLIEVDGHGVPRKISDIRQRVLNALQDADFPTDGIVVSGRVKDPWAIQEKRLRKIFNAVQTRYENLKKKADVAHAAGELDGKAYQTRVEALRAQRDNKIIPALIWDRPDITKIQDVIALRIEFPDALGEPTEQKLHAKNHRVVSRANKILARGNGFLPVAGRYKDYILKPKSNGYRSLHNGFRAGEQEIEVQMLTKSMHEANSGGNKRHAAHKTNGGRPQDHDLKSQYHPALRRMNNGEVGRFAYIMDTIDRSRARVEHDALPEHLPRSYLTVSTRGGQRGLGWVLREIDNPEATLADLAKDIDSRLLGRTCGVIHNGNAYVLADAHDEVKAQHPNANELSITDFRDIMRARIRHCDFVEFLTVPSPSAAPVRGHDRWSRMPTHAHPELANVLV